MKPSLHHALTIARADYARRATGRFPARARRRFTRDLTTQLFATYRTGQQARNARNALAAAATLRLAAEILRHADRFARRIADFETDPHDLLIISSTPHRHRTIQHQSLRADLKHHASRFQRYADLLTQNPYNQPAIPGSYLDRTYTWTTRPKAHPPLISYTQALQLHERTPDFQTAAWDARLARSGLTELLLDFPTFDVPQRFAWVRIPYHLPGDTPAIRRTFPQPPQPGRPSAGRCIHLTPLGPSLTSP